MLSMPLATIKVIEGVFSADEKQRMIEKVTEAMVSVKSCGKRQSSSLRKSRVATGELAARRDAVKQLRASR
jgi:4-oxalocrotonate tautomerase